MPPGDVVVRVTVSDVDGDRAAAALRDAGFTVRRDASPAQESPTDAAEPILEIIKSTGSDNPAADAQRAVHEAASRALALSGIQHRLGSTGVILSGGTAADAWLDVVLDGERIGLKILAKTDAEADAQLNGVAQELGIARDRLNIAPRPGWAGYGYAPPEP